MPEDKFWWKGHEFIVVFTQSGITVLCWIGELHPEYGFRQTCDMSLGEHGKYYAADQILENYKQWAAEMTDA